jgi:hypothetical protein
MAAGPGSDSPEPRSTDSLPLPACHGSARHMPASPAPPLGAGPPIAVPPIAVPTSARPPSAVPISAGYMIESQGGGGSRSSCAEPASAPDSPAGAQLRACSFSQEQVRAAADAWSGRSGHRPVPPGPKLARKGTGGEAGGGAGGTAGVTAARAVPTRASKLARASTAAPPPHQQQRPWVAGAGPEAGAGAGGAAGRGLASSGGGSGACGYSQAEVMAASAAWRCEPPRVVFGGGEGSLASGCGGPLAVGPALSSEGRHEMGHGHPNLRAYRGGPAVAVAASCAAEVPLLGQARSVGGEARSAGGESHSLGGEAGAGCGAGKGAGAAWAAGGGRGWAGSASMSRLDELDELLQVKP